MGDTFTGGDVADAVSPLPLSVPVPMVRSRRSSHAPVGIGPQRKNVTVPVGVSNGLLPTTVAVSVHRGARSHGPGGRGLRRHRLPAQSPSWPREKSNSVAVKDCEERVSARNVVKHLPPRSLSVRLTPPSKNSACRRLWPTPSSLFAVSHGVVIVPPTPSLGALTVAQASSPGGSVVQSEPLATAWPSQVAGLSGLLDAAAVVSAPAVDVDRADGAAVGEGGHDQQVAVLMVAGEA